MSVLVSVAVAGIVVSLSAVAYRNLTFERRLIQTKNSFREVEGALKNLVITTIRDKIAGSDCETSVAVGSNIGNMVVQTSKNIYLKTKSSVLARKLGPLQQAAARCAREFLPGVADNTFRFCVTMTPVPGARPGAPDSFSGSKDTFAEIQVTMMDFTTGQPVTCAQFQASPRTTGFIVTTGLYWVSSSEVGPVPNSNIGFSYVPGA